MKSSGGPQWFEGMKNTLGFIKEKEYARLVKTMLFSNLVKLFCPELF